MKKTKVFILAAALAMAVLSSCASEDSSQNPEQGTNQESNEQENNEPEKTASENKHEHTFATEWTFDCEKHWHAATCEHTSEVKDSAAHTLGEWTVIKASTTDEEGEAKRSCNICDYEETKTIAKLHMHVVGTKHEAVAGTCSQKGTLEYYDCANSDCIEKLNASGEVLSSVEGELNPNTHTGTLAYSKKDGKTHIAFYNCCNKVYNSNASHNWNNGIVTKESTCNETGEVVYTCKECGEEDTKTLDARSHEYVSNVIGLSKYCKNCGYNKYFTDTNYRVEIYAQAITKSSKFTPTSWVLNRELSIRNLYVSDHEVTRGEYLYVMGNDPTQAVAHKTNGSIIYSSNDADTLNNPVTNVSWYDAIEFCNKLSELEKLVPCYKIDKENKDSNNSSTKDEKKWTVTWNRNATGYRLPTEVEWEFIARYGKNQNSIVSNYNYPGSDNADEVAHYNKKKLSNLEILNSGFGTICVRSLKPTETPKNGVYDMAGNVSEWCWDWFDSDLTSNISSTGPVSGKERVTRGGGWRNLAADKVNLRGSCEDPDASRDDIGFRVVRNVIR